MLERNLQRATLAGSQRSCRGAEYGTCFAEGDLVHLIDEGHGYFKLAEGAIAGIHSLTVEDGDLLIQKIFGAAQSPSLEMNFRSISALLRAEWRVGSWR